jgi:hypothetical protein
LQTITDNIVNLINKAPDPNVTASPDDTTDTIILTAIQDGPNGANITYSTSVSTGAQEAATAAGTNLDIYLENPTQVAPGTLVQIYGQNLCDTTATADLTKAYLPFTLGNCQVYVDGVRIPLLYVSPVQFNAQIPWYLTDRTSISLYVRTIHADGSVSVTTPVPVTILFQNPGIFAQYGSDPRPGYFFHGSSFANDAVEVNGSIQAGDIGTITIGNSSYSYTVQSTDTIGTVQTALIKAINNGHDPNVLASAADENYAIVLTALLPGPTGEGTTISASVTGNATTALVLTATNPTMCCDNIQGAPVTAQNPAQPGETVYLLATGLGVTSQGDVDTGAIYQPGLPPHPPAYPIDTSLIGASSGTLLSSSLVPGTVGVYYVQFQIPTGLTTDLATQMHISQQATISNIVTIPIATPSTNTTPVPSIPALRHQRASVKSTQ